MEREDRTLVATFHAPVAWGALVELDDAAAHHAVVKRLGAGERIRLTNGRGQRASATIQELGKRRFTVALDPGSVEHVSAPSHAALWTPIGDRDRMLILAEKAVELGVTVWQPVRYARSKSVSPRGEGDAFRDKVLRRQISALEQSGSAWLPECRADVDLPAALASDSTKGGGTRLLMDAAGIPIARVLGELEPAVRVAVGPEGGLDDDERQQFVEAGWRLVSLGANVLRFETACIAALALVRSHLR